MATQVTNYQCPSCTGPLHFSAETGKLKCEYCGSSFDPAEIERLYQEKTQAAAEADRQEDEKPAGAASGARAGSEWDEAEAASLRVYNCPSCGAEILCDGTTAATRCVYCGNPSVVPGRLSGNLKPDYIIPFQLDRQAAVDALKRHCRGKPLLPRAFRSQNRIEQLQGVYVPFWLYDCETSGRVEYSANTVRTWAEGDWDVTERTNYLVTRGGTVRFEQIPVDGSTKMPDDHMDAIEPFDYAGLVPFSLAYLPGYLADKYDVDQQASAERARKRAEQSASELFLASVSGYDSVTEKDRALDFAQKDVKYALLPVWLLNTKWNGKDYLFAMNGQTGKLIGDLPVSRGLACAWLFGIWAVLSALAILIQVL